MLPDDAHVMAKDFLGYTMTTVAQTLRTSILESDPPQILHHSPIDIKANQWLRGQGFTFDIMTGGK